MCLAGSPCQNVTLADEPVPLSLSSKDLGFINSRSEVKRTQKRDNMQSFLSPLFPKLEHSRGTTKQHETQIGEIDGSAHPPIC